MLKSDDCFNFVRMSADVWVQNIFLEWRNKTQKGQEKENFKQLKCHFAMVYHREIRSENLSPPKLFCNYAGLIVLVGETLAHACLIRCLYLSLPTRRH